MADSVLFLAILHKEVSVAVYQMLISKGILFPFGMLWFASVTGSSFLKATFNQDWIRYGLLLKLIVIDLWISVLFWILCVPFAAMWFLWGVQLSFLEPEPIVKCQVLAVDIQGLFDRDQLAMDDECCICLQDLKEDICQSKQCKHRFHFKCIEQWSSQSLFCPLCKQSFQEPTIVQIP
jgi:hypothetical protein